jgi:hypothetical protein
MKPVRYLKDAKIQDMFCQNKKSSVFENAAFLSKKLTLAHPPRCWDVCPCPELPVLPWPLLP